MKSGNQRRALARITLAVAAALACNAWRASGVRADDITITSADQRVTTTTYTYDAHADAGGTTPSTGTTKYVYDADTTTTPTAPTTPSKYTYDSQDTITAPSGANYNYKLTDADDDGEGSQYQYDNGQNGSVSSYTDPDANAVGTGTVHTYTYDTANGSITQNDPQGITTTYQYDSRAGVVGTTESDGTGIGSSYKYMYDTIGNQLTVGAADSASGDEIFNYNGATTYDAQGEIDVTGGPLTLDLTITLYDNNGNPALIDIMKQVTLGGTGNPSTYSYMVSPTQIPLDDLNDNTTFTYQYSLTPTNGSGIATADLNLGVSTPLPHSAPMGAALLAAIGLGAGARRSRLLRSSCYV